jgi:sugar phosphate isomerase/epimerase
MLPSPFAVNTYSYVWRYTARECLEHLADLGFTRFEILVNPPHLWPSTLERAERDAVAHLLATRGLRITSLNPPSLDLNLVAPAAEMRRYTIDHYRDVIRLAGEWGAPWVIVMPGKTHPLLPAPRERVLDWCRSALDELLALAEPLGVALLLENIPAAFLPRAQDLVGFLDDYGHPGLGIVYDVANGVFVGEAPDEGILACRPHLRLVHLSDTGTERWAHGPVGSGVVPFAAAAAALAEIGYANPSVLEIISLEPERDIPESAGKLRALGWSGT